jgi:hypothetical protein
MLVRAMKGSALYLTLLDRRGRDERRVCRQDRSLLHGSNTNSRD